MYNSTVTLEGYRHQYFFLRPDQAILPSVVALHGFGTTGFRTYRHVAPHLSAAGIPIYAPDLLGTGGSDKPDINYSLELYARLNSAFLGELNLEKPVLLGHSMGGKIAAATAVLFEDLYSGLILVNSGGFSNLEPLLPIVAGTSFVNSLISSDLVFKYILPRTPLGPVFRHEESLNQLAQYRRSHHTLTLSRTSIKEKLKDMQIPTLILWGKRDQLIPPSVPHKMNRMIPGARLQFIEHAGHAPMKDQPVEFATAIIRFVRELADKNPR